MFPDLGTQHVLSFDEHLCQHSSRDNTEYAVGNREYGYWHQMRTRCSQSEVVVGWEECVAKGGQR